MKMVRTSLIAAAAGVLISPALMAANVATPTTSAFVSDEYLSTAVAADVIAHPIVGFSIGAEYAVGDVITLALSGDALDDSTLPTSIVAACQAPVPVDLPNGISGVTLGLLSSSSAQAVYRVTELDLDCGATSTINQTFGVCTIAAPCDFNAQAVDSANGVTMSFSATTGTGLALDTSGGADRSAAVFLTGSQFAPDVNFGFDGVIDVSEPSERTLFEFGNSVDQASFDVASDDEPDDSELAYLLADVDGYQQDVTVEADWSFLFDQLPDAGIQADGVFWSNCGAISYSATSIEASCDYDVNSVITVDVEDNTDPDTGALAVLPATSFVSTHVLNYAGIGGVESFRTVTNIGLGAWTLNGFQAKVAYMPFQTGIGQVIYLANRSAQSGEITVDWIDQNGNSGSFGIGTIEAGSTRAIGTAIRNGLPAAQQNGGRLALIITANVPACNAQLNAQYNVSGDRAFSVSTNNCPVSAEVVGFFD